MPYYERRIQSGRMLEVETYYATRTRGEKPLPRSANVNETRRDQEAVNERNAQKRLKRLIMANFSSENGDLFVTYTYGRQVTEEEATKGERNLLARIRRLRAKKGLPELRYIVVTECQGNWHHHIIMSGGLTLDEIRAVWGDRGSRLQLSTLDDSRVCNGLARYLTEQHKSRKGEKSSADNAKQPRRKGQRRWHASRNLQELKETCREVRRLPKGEPKPPKGYRLLPDWIVGCDMWGNLYRYYTCIHEEEPKAKGKADGGRGRRQGGKRGSAQAALKPPTEGVRGRSPGGARGRAPAPE